MQQNITTGIITITPEMAEQMLKFNTRNRPVNQLTVDDYALQMKKGLWRLNGEPIIITPEANGMSAGKFGTVITFKRDDCVGRPKQPLVIKTDLASAIDDAPFLMPNAQLTVYDLRGQLVYRGSGAQFDRNMLRPNTVYIVSEVTEDGRTFCRKMEFNKQ